MLPNLVRSSAVSDHVYHVLSISIASVADWIGRQTSPPSAVIREDLVMS